MSKKAFSTNDIPPNEAFDQIHYSSNEKAAVFNTVFASQSSIEGNDDEVPDVLRVNTCTDPLVLSVTDVKKKKKVLKGAPAH